MSENILHQWTDGSYKLRLINRNEQYIIQQMGFDGKNYDGRWYDQNILTEDEHWLAIELLMKLLKIEEE